MPYRYLLACFLLFSVLPAAAQPVVQLQALQQTFSEPTDVLSDGVNDNVLYVVQKDGVINRYDMATETVSLVLDLRQRVDARSEGGALGAAFHPQFPDSNYLYVNYTTAGSPLTTTISRFTLDNAGVGLDPSERVLLTIDQPAANHNAGDLAFGPDGYLYIPTGDGGGANDQYERAQDPMSLLGKLLRIDVTQYSPDGAYGIPEDNPFIDRSDTLSEIWALGLRNPWRISFDRETGDLWIGDVGQGAREEVNFVAAESPGGMNFGWNCREGLIAGTDPVAECDPAITYTDPLFDYPHSGNGDVNGESITGGFVYRGPAADLQGYYVFGDFVQPRFFLYDTRDGADPAIVTYTDLPAQNISTFGEGVNGDLYVADYGGTIYRVTTEQATPVAPEPSTTAGIAVYPNPAAGRINLRFATVAEATAPAALRSMDGRTVARWAEVRIADGQAAIELPRLAAGTYLLSLPVEGREYVARISVQ